GIYRDCWMIVHNNVFITDSNYENETAGGGLFVSYDKVSEQSAQVNMDAHIRNASGKAFKGKVVYELYDRNGKQVVCTEKNISVRNGSAGQVSGKMEVESPHLWSPDSPYLYRLHVYVKDKGGQIVDGY